MIRQLIARHGYAASVAVLLVGIVVVAGYLLVVALPTIQEQTAGRQATAEPSAAPSASPRSAMALSPIGIEMPAGADCTACHVTASGAVGTKPIPKLGHPLLGFRDCTACHKPDGLVQTAPGHSGIHKDECLVCHQVPVDVTASGSLAPMRPEHMGIDQPCTACHGVDEHAPLPADMQGRDSCWICHNGPEFQYLFASPGASPEASSVPSPAALGRLQAP
jgi:hypothetical protein